VGSVGFFDYVGYDAFGLVFVVVSDFVYVVSFVSAAVSEGCTLPRGPRRVPLVTRPRVRARAAKPKTKLPNI
jgi:hypothetical protein